METLGDGMDRAATGPAQTQPSMSKFTRVLVVEDEQDIAALIKHTLERSGDIQASIVGSGDVALRSIAERPPDLIILDLNLPVLGGLEVCRILRSRPNTAETPIIMLTAKTTREAVIKGLAGGADGYITKPFQTDVLVKAIKTMFGISDGAAANK